MRPDKSYASERMSPVIFAYVFCFYSYYIWFQRQVKKDRSTNHVSELYAWAVLSLNMTMLVNIIICSIILASPAAMDAWRNVANMPRILLFGWSYPITLVLNYRALFGAWFWKRISNQMDDLPRRKRSLGFAIVFAASVSIFVGTFALAFAVM
jgi:hypothetical protein